MKKLTPYFIALWALMLTFVLHSCNDDGYSLGNFQRGMATVRTEGNSFYLEIDNGKTLFPAAPAYLHYQAVDGQRVVANYTLLYDNYYGYDYGVRINSLTNVLTKTVEELNAGNEEEFGNDPVPQLLELWMGGNYLNVVYLLDISKYEPRRVSLVENTLAENPDDGYIYLEYRYNTYEDVSGYGRKSMVSFNLKHYFTDEYTTYKGIKVKFNLWKEGEKIYRYEFKDAQDDTHEVEDPQELA